MPYEPVVLPWEEVTKGESWTPAYEIVKGDGSPEPMAGRTLVQRLRHRATQPAPLTRTFGVGGEAELVSPSTNIVRFLWEKAALVNLPWGIYDVELYFQDTGPTPDQEQIYGRGEILLRSPTTGTL